MWAMACPNALRHADARCSNPARARACRNKRLRGPFVAGPSRFGWLDLSCNPAKPWRGFSGQAECRWPPGRAQHPTARLLSPRPSHVEALACLSG